MSNEGHGHFFTIYFPGFVCFVLYLAKISGERLQDHWSSGFIYFLLLFRLRHCGMLGEFLDKNVNMNKNYTYPTTMYESIFAQMYVCLVLFIIFGFYH